MFLSFTWVVWLYTVSRVGWSDGESLKSRHSSASAVPARHQSREFLNDNIVSDYYLRISWRIYKCQDIRWCGGDLLAEIIGWRSPQLLFLSASELSARSEWIYRLRREIYFSYDICANWSQLLQFLLVSHQKKGYGVVLSPSSTYNMTWHISREWSICGGPPCSNREDRSGSFFNYCSVHTGGRNNWRVVAFL